VILIGQSSVTLTEVNKRDRDFFRLLMIIAYIATLSFSIFFYVHDVLILAYNGLFCFSLYVVFGIISFFTPHRLALFRLSILTAFWAFFSQVYFTGGVLSPSLAEFIIPPIIAFFYRPIRDRYFFMILSVLCAVSMWPLTIGGFTADYFPVACKIENSMFSTLFVFAVIVTYTYLFRKSLSQKNQQLQKIIKDLQSTSQKLIHSEKMASLGVMSAGVAHEINNPLNFIKGGIQMLSRQLENSEEAKPFIQAVDEGVNRASSIVNSLGHFSRESVNRNEECDIHTIIDNCLVMIQHKLKYRIDVNKKYCDARPLKIIGNEGQLHQAVLNMLSNAEQAITEKGTITIETCTISENLKLSIADSGTGISPENLSKIGDPFFTTKSAGQGTGLGLSIAYKIIEEHSGVIDVTSEFSKGTRFDISFQNPKLILS